MIATQLQKGTLTPYLLTLVIVVVSLQAVLINGFVPNNNNNNNGAGLQIHYHPPQQESSRQTLQTTRTVSQLFQSYDDDDDDDGSSTASSSSSSSSSSKPRTNVKLPLLDWLEFEQSVLAKNGDVENFILPLPSSQLPTELSTPFLYGIQLERPIDKLIMEEAKTIHDSGENYNNSDDDDDDENETPSSSILTSNKMSSDRRPIFGRLVCKNDSSTLVGAIGCTAEIFISSPMDEMLQGMDDDFDFDMNMMMMMDDSDGGAPSDTPPTTMLCRGDFRFVVKSVVQSIPYPIVIVDELVDNDDDGSDDEDTQTSTPIDNDHDDEEDDDDDDDEYLDDYDTMPAEELIQKIMSIVQKVITQKVDDAESKERSLLEESILENTTTNDDPSKVPLDLTTIEQYQAEEMAAVWEIFQSSMIDDIEPSQRRFVLSMMAAELASLDNPARTRLLQMTNSLERLRFLTGKLDQVWGMQQARKLASQITEKTDEDDKDLKVGLPTLPPWAKTIHKGSRVEYYWNEEYDWVAGEVMQEPTIEGGAFDELEVMLITVQFDDGEVHTIPLSGEDKARWRPEE
ncbi:unnamed protein product [Cylindrotheca closterium]|uniref:Uncharacterized protein n=1 Tax=Cylindrotheca closterium TaxID=2856 RepID=A0AAD2CVU9_9STRA|nr:unnamed protein product [Cylindrotheca closterium]